MLCFCFIVFLNTVYCQIKGEQKWTNNESAEWTSVAPDENDCSYNSFQSAAADKFNVFKFEWKEAQSWKHINLIQPVPSPVVGHTWREKDNFQDVKDHLFQQHCVCVFVYLSYSTVMCDINYCISCLIHI